MPVIADQLLIVVLLINFMLLGSSRLRFAVRTVAVQGTVLGVVPALLHPISPYLVLITICIVLVKGVVIPYLINNAITKTGIDREQDPFIGYLAILMIGAVTTAASFAFAGTLPLAPGHQEQLIVPASLATLMTGFLILTSRKKAIYQVIGYLVLENGIFIFGMLLTEAMPFMVEAGVLLDLLVGIFVMGIVINHISREFCSLDTTRMRSLRED